MSPNVPFSPVSAKFFAGSGAEGVSEDEPGSADIGTRVRFQKNLDEENDVPTPMSPKGASFGNYILA